MLLTTLRGMNDKKDGNDGYAPRITELLFELGDGKKIALDRLMPLVEMEMRRIAHKYMTREGNHQTLQTTALINEAYLRLVEQRDVRWQNRAHFFGISAQIMRRILIDDARDRLTAKRGGKVRHISLDDAENTAWEKSSEILALNEALEKLARFDPLKSRIVELRYFTGLTIEETAEVLGIAAVTVSVNWRLAKAWLSREILSQ